MIAILLLLLGVVWLSFIPRAWRALFRMARTKRTSYALLWIPRKIDGENNRFEFLLITSVSSMVCLLHTIIGLCLVYLGAINLDWMSVVAPSP